MEITRTDALGLLTWSEEILRRELGLKPADASAKDGEVTGAGRIDEELLSEQLGAFATLKTRQPAEGEALRGCIGRFAGSGPLRGVIPQVVKDAALHDTRFAPVQARELDGIRVELSVLSEAWDLNSAEQIVLGSHGIILSARGRRSVFLPEVATEQGWDVEMTLQMLGRKSGAGLEAWREPGARISVFRAWKIRWIDERCVIPANPEEDPIDEAHIDLRLL